MKTHKDWFRVLIVGCGQLGSRHLQAVASLANVREIEVVDPTPAALELGRQRLAELPDRQCGTIFRWLRSVEEASKDGDLCIVATQADVRCQLVYQVAETLEYRSFLLEVGTGFNPALSSEASRSGRERRGNPRYSGVHKPALK